MDRLSRCLLQLYLALDLSSYIIPRLLSNATKVSRVIIVLCFIYPMLRPLLCLRRIELRLLLSPGTPRLPSAKLGKYPKADVAHLNLAGKVLRETCQPRLRKSNR